MPTSFDEFVAERLDGLLRWAKIESAPTYARRMVTNEYLSWRRRAIRRVVPSSHEALDAISPPEADPATAYDERDAMPSRLATLPRKQRAALVLRYYESYTDDEIAEVLSCGTSTVRSQISRAPATLRVAVHPSPLTTGSGE